MRTPQKRSRTGAHWHGGTWQPFESVRLACERSAERLGTNSSMPVFLPSEIYLELGFLKDLNDNLRQLVLEMREYTEQAKVRLERLEKAG